MSQEGESGRFGEDASRYIVNATVYINHLELRGSFGSKNKALAVARLGRVVECLLWFGAGGVSEDGRPWQRVRPSSPSCMDATALAISSSRDPTSPL